MGEDKNKQLTKQQTVQRNISKLINYQRKLIFKNTAFSPHKIGKCFKET